MNDEYFDYYGHSRLREICVFVILWIFKAVNKCF